jgi:hypothetical protein
MAIPLNSFKNFSAVLTTSDTVLYTVPVDVTTIVLMAQITNVTNTTPSVTFWHEDASSNVTELIKDFSVPKNDAIAGLLGKLVLEFGYTLHAQASANNTLKITLSVLETSNV